MTKDSPDYGRIASLLTIVKDTVGVAPGYTHIIGAAMNELREINKKLSDVASANRAPPTNPLALQAAQEPEKKGIPTNELGPDSERTKFDDLKDPEAAIRQKKKDDERALQEAQERQQAMEENRRREQELRNQEAIAGEPNPDANEENATVERRV